MAACAGMPAPSAPANASAISEGFAQRRATNWRRCTLPAVIKRYGVSHLLGMTDSCSKQVRVREASRHKRGNGTLVFFENGLPSVTLVEQCFEHLDQVVAVANQDRTRVEEGKGGTVR